MEAYRVFLFVLSLSLLSGCSNALETGDGSLRPSDQVQASVPVIAPEVVTLSQISGRYPGLRASQDEFDNSIYVDQIKTKYTKAKGAVFTLSPGVAKYSADSNWVLDITSVYSGERWLGTTIWDLKSSAGFMEIVVDPDFVTGDVSERGSVTETSLTDLTEDQTDLFCRIVSGNKVKFRITGKTGPLRVIGAYPDEQKLAAISSCELVTDLRNGKISLG